MLGTELESCGRTVSTPNCCAISPAPLLVNLVSDIHNHFRYFPKLFISIESNRKTHDSQILSANTGHMINLYFSELHSFLSINCGSRWFSQVAGGNANKEPNKWPMSKHKASVPSEETGIHTC